MKILKVDASTRKDNSISRQLSTRFIDKLSTRIDIQVDHVDLADSPPEHFQAIHTQAIYTPSSEHSPEMKLAMKASNDYCARILNADAIVISTPIHNFSVPSPLKAFIDHISRSGVTFHASETGLVGSLGGKRFACISAFGGNYASGEAFEGMDCLTPLINAVFTFLGIEKIQHVSAWPTSFDSQQNILAARVAAENSVDSLADDWINASMNF